MSFLPAATHRAQQALTSAPWLPWHLLLDKYSFPDPDYQPPDDQSAKLAALGSICAAYRSADQQARLKESCHAKRAFRTALRAQLGDARFREVFLVSASRVVPHLGRPAALENVGLAFDRITGLPILPGSSVKGLISTWACWEENVDAADQTVHEGTAFKRSRGSFAEDLARRVLGKNPEEDPGGASDRLDAAGEVIFLGGFPLSPPEIELDLVNPHHDESGNPKEQLVPSPFLAWGMGCTWVFCFFTRAGAREPQLLLDTTERWLGEALTQYGIGAKAAAGYGRFLKPADFALKYPDMVQQVSVSSSAGAGAALRSDPDKLPKPKRAFPTYDSYVARTKDWVLVADTLPTKPKCEQEFIVRFLSTPEGRALLSAWKPNLNTMRRKANLASAGWKEEP